MAHQLTHEVLDHAPPDLSTAEAMVLTVIAYHAQLEHRRCWMPAEEMQARTRLSATGLRQAMQRLAKRGLECRVARGVTKAGEPVYAYRGRTTTYRLPAFPVPDGCGCLRGSSRPRGEGDALEAVGAQNGDASHEKGDALEAVGAQNGDASHEKGDAQPPASIHKGDAQASPSPRKGDASQEKGDVSELERRRLGVAQYERTKDPVGTTEVTTGRARPRTATAPPSTNVGPPPPAPPPPPPPPPPPAPLPGWGPVCGRPDCRDPGPCRACGDVRRAHLDAETAQATKLGDLAHHRHLERQRAARAAAAAAPRVPSWACDGGREARRRGPVRKPQPGSGGGRHRAPDPAPPAHDRPDDEQRAAS